MEILRERHLYSSYRTAIVLSIFFLNFFFFNFEILNLVLSFFVFIILLIPELTSPFRKIAIKILFLIISTAILGIFPFFHWVDLKSYLIFHDLFYFFSLLHSPRDLINICIFSLVSILIPLVVLDLDQTTMVAHIVAHLFSLMWFVPEFWKWEKLEKLEHDYSDMGKVFSLVFHEINSVLRRIEYEKKIDVIKLEIADLKKMIIFYSSFYGQSKKVTMIEVNLRNLVDTVLRPFEHILTSYKIEIVFKGQSEIRVLSEIFLLKEMIRLALKNCFEEIATWPIDQFSEHRKIEISLHDNEIVISNFAPAMNQAFLEKMFYPYVTTRKGILKRGLGLFIAKKVWGAYGGKMKAQLAHKNFSLHLVFPGITSESNP